MKTLTNFLLTLLLSVSCVYAQVPDIIISGIAVDEYNKPMYGLVLYEKGATNAVIVDMDGSFFLRLAGDKKHTVVISYIGYPTTEIVVDKSDQWELIFYDEYFDLKRGLSGFGWNPPVPVLSHKLRNEEDGDGVFYMKDNLLQSYNSESLSRIKAIQLRGQKFSIIEAKRSQEYNAGYQLFYTSALDIATVGRLPEWPAQYVHQQQINNQSCSPEDFFRTGISFNNTLNVKLPGFALDYIDIALGQKKNNSPIPTSYKETYNISLAMKEIKTGYVKSEVGILYNTSYGRLPLLGSNMASVMYPVFNPLGEEATIAEDADSWLKQLPDREKNKHLLTYLKTEYQKERVTWQNNISFDKRWNRIVTGTLPGNDNPRLTQRKDQIADVSFYSGLNWRTNRYDPVITLLAGYTFRHSRDKFLYINELPMSEIVAMGYDEKLIRNSHDVKYGLKFEKPVLYLEAATSHYFSTTAHARDYFNMFPELGGKLWLERLFEDLFDWDNHTLAFYGNIKRSIGEVALVDRNPAALSTIWKAADFRNYYEYQLPVYNDLVKPETYVKSEIGLNYLFGYNSRLGVDINGYNYNTHDLVMPVIESAVNSAPVLSNVGRLHSYGYFIDVKYENMFGRSWYFTIKSGFSQGKTKATTIYNHEEFVRIGGFSDISTVLAKGDPLGAIYGSSYQRDGQGKIVTENNGNPVLQDGMTKIGDPTPDFMVNLNSGVSYNDFSLHVWFDYKHGGDRWNGTRAFIDSQAGNIKTVIGEDYIEKANFFRFSNITFKYIVRPRRALLDQLSVGVSAKNLFLITSYKGVDPATNMFGYPGTNGLDLFNTPSMRSYSLIVTLGF